MKPPREVDDAAALRYKSNRTPRSNAAFGRLARIGGFAALLPLAGCPYYAAPPPGTVITTPASFDRSFSAASGAIRDQGLTITVEDPGSGTIVGELSGAIVTATVRQQADGSVVVQFNARNARDPALIDRVSRGYDTRMGR